LIAPPLFAKPHAIEFQQGQKKNQGHQNGKQHGSGVENEQNQDRQRKQSC
jgi:hypothetical protein